MSRHMRAEAGTSANNSRVYSFSYLRAAACFAIVLLHTVFCAVSLFPEEASATQALLSNIVVNNMMWAVPCFLMVSGALLLNPERPVTVKNALQSTFRACSSRSSCSVFCSAHWRSSSITSPSMPKRCFRAFMRFSTAPRGRTSGISTS